MTSQTGTFTVSFDATPSASPNNAVVGLASGAQTAYTGFACLVRFNTSGDIDVRNGGSYTAATTLPFSAGSTYHVVETVNVPAHTYSVTVTPPGGSAVALASNYAFRTEQASVANLDTWAVYVDASGGSGTLQVCNFALGGSGPYGGTPAAIPGTVEAENYDLGGQGVGYSVTSVNGTGNSYRSDGVDLETTTDTGGGYDVGWTGAGQWFTYTVNVASAGAYNLTFRVAAPSAVTGAFHLSDASGNNLSGAVNVPATGGWQTWTTVTATATLSAGQQTLTLNQDNGGWNINNFGFATATQSCPTATAGGTWQTSPIGTTETGNFTATFDATPSASPSNAIVGLSSGAQTAYTGYACIVRFNTSGDIDARNGGSYTAASVIPFAAGSTYHFRLAVNVPSHVYSIYVTPPGGSEITVGSNYAFRTEQNTVSSLDTWAAYVDANGGSGTLQVCSFSATTSTGGAPVAPAFSPAPGTYTGGQTVTITDATGGASIYYTTDGTTPTTSSTPYTGPVTISSSTGLSAIAVNSVGSSSVTSGNYFIESSAGFIHPGVSVNKQILDLIKQRVAQGVDPQVSAFNAATASSFGSLSYTPHPWQTVECGPSSNPDYGCTDEKKDSAAAYTQALLWYITGNRTYANNAINIMNAWAQTLTGGHTNSNAPLEAAWTGANWPRAAEIMAYSNSGWVASDIAAFKNMLVTQYMPYVINGSCSNGNWEASMAEAVINMAVFLDNQSDFQQGLKLWRGRTPAYFYLSSDGSSPILPDGGACSMPNWYTTQPILNGQCQETCRDMQHTQYGFAALLDAAETARQQGVDLFGEQANRIMTTMEFHTNYLNGASVPSSLCGGTLGLNSYHPTWIIAYNHYHFVLGYSLPNSQQADTNSATTGVDHHMVWEKLTHGDVGAVGLPPITQP